MQMQENDLVEKPLLQEMQQLEVKEAAARIEAQMEACGEMEHPVVAVVVEAQAEPDQMMEAKAELLEADIVHPAVAVIDEPGNNG